MYGNDITNAGFAVGVSLAVFQQMFLVVVVIFAVIGLITCAKIIRHRLLTHESGDAKLQV